MASTTGICCESTSVRDGTSRPIYTLGYGTAGANYLGRVTWGSGERILQQLRVAAADRGCDLDVVVDEDGVVAQRLRDVRSAEERLQAGAGTEVKDVDPRFHMERLRLSLR